MTKLGSGNRGSGRVASVVGGGCGSLAGTLLLIFVGLPIGFIASQRCVNAGTGAQVACSDSWLLIGIAVLTMASIPLLAILGAKVARGSRPHGDG